MLLGTQPAGARVEAPALDLQIRPGGLAAWQAKRTLAHIEANLGAKMAIEETLHSPEDSPTNRTRIDASAASSAPAPGCGGASLKGSAVQETHESSRRRSQTDLILSIADSAANLAAKTRVKTLAVE
jgi:hypothetical protein